MYIHMPIRHAALMRSPRQVLQQATRRLACDFISDMCDAMAVDENPHGHALTSYKTVMKIISIAGPEVRIHRHTHPQHDFTQQSTT